MPKKEWTEAERMAFGLKMQAARAAKTKQAIINDSAAPQEPQAPAPTSQSGSEELSALQRRVEELTALVERVSTQPVASFPQPAPAQPQFSHRGSLVGTFEKYVVDPKNYPDPSERLGQEPKLQRFAFGQNYDLAWSVSTTSYQTQDGVNTREPRFDLELRRIVFDEETGLPTDTRYSVCKLIFHEDPQAALVVARDNGIEPDEFPGGEKAFLDEMRYMRARDWLLEAFYPPTTDTIKKQRRDVVIGGKLVEVFDISSENAERMPFDQIGKSGKVF